MIHFTPWLGGLLLACVPLWLSKFTRGLRPYDLRIVCILAVGVAWWQPMLALSLGFTGLLGRKQMALWQWRGLGLIRLRHPAGAWILAAGAGLLAASPAGAWALALPLLVRLRPSWNPGELTPCRATLLLRLPLVVVNICLEQIPLETQRLWFRPDPMRLHLRQPLLEIQNAPAYFAALAEALNRQLGTAIAHEQQLLDFCYRQPVSVAQVLWSEDMASPLGEALSLPQGFSSDNLAGLRKPGLPVQLAHLLKLRRISK